MAGLCFETRDRAGNARERSRFSSSAWESPRSCGRPSGCWRWRGCARASGDWSLVIIRRNPIWGLLILLTVGVTLMLSTAPRYYVMIVPFVLLSSLVALSSVTQRMPGGWGDLVLLAWMGMVVGTNIARMVPFFAS